MGQLLKFSFFLFAFFTLIVANKDDSMQFKRGPASLKVKEGQACPYHDKVKEHNINNLSE